MSDPASAVAQAFAQVRGKRTGIMLGKKGSIPVEKDSGMEDVDTFWDNAKSPDAVVNNVAAKKKKKKPSGTQPLKQRNQQGATEKLKPRMSLPNASKVGSEAEPSSTKRVNKFLSRALSSKGAKVDWSPSDLSRVSTAPPTPASTGSGDNMNVTPNERAEEEKEEEAPLNDIVPEDNVPYSPPEAARASPPEADEQSLAQKKQSIDSVEKEVPIPITNEEDNNDQIMMEEDALPSFDDDEDDLLPPPPPEDDNNDEEDDQNHLPDPLENTKSPVESPSRVDIPNTVEDTEMMQNNDDNELEDDDGDLDDDKEGTGFSMVHDPETPESVRAERLQQEKEELERKKKSKKKREKDLKTPKPKAKKVKSKKVTYASPLGYPAGNRDYQAVPVSDFKESPEPGVRRSGRAKMAPLQWWKNERPIYGIHHEEGVLGEAMGDMPVVVDVLKAMPTPYKKRKLTKIENSTQKKSDKKSKTAGSGSAKNTVTESPFDDRRLRKKLKIVDGEVAHLWDDALDEATDMKVVAHAKNMLSTKLPTPKARRKGESKVVGEASQAFNIPTDDNSIYMGYIMGKLELPPRGIKDSEAVGGCSQTFTVCSCQPGSLEVAFADPHSPPDGELDPETAQRFLLHPGDMFRIPPGNCYRIENHSKTTDCLLTWTIIRPRLVQP